MDRVPQAVSNTFEYCMAIDPLPFQDVLMVRQSDLKVNLLGGPPIATHVTGTIEGLSICTYVSRYVVCHTHAPCYSHIGLNEMPFGKLAGTLVWSQVTLY